MLNRGLDKQELLRIVEAVANEKSIDKELVIGSMESAIQKAALTKFGNDNNIEVKISRETGEIKINKVIEIVEKVEDPSKEISLDLAQKSSKKNKDLKIGDKISEELPQIDFGRIAAQSAKQVISFKVREAEKQKTIDRFEDDIGQLVNGVVKRVDRNGFHIDIGNNSEAFLPRREMIPKEAIRPQDRIRALLKDINADLKGPPLILSRVMPEFLIELFKVEVPEITQNLIEIVGASRDPGLRAKIAVRSDDKRIDAVGACVGMRGSRVQSVSNELNGERIDIILWSDNNAQYVVNAMSPANVVSIVVDEENQPTLTLAIDLNTMLSFEANTRTEGTNSFNSGADMSGGAKYDKAFFYASRINNQMMAFLGDSGDVHGYSVNSCYTYEDGNPNNTGDRAVKSWMTVIFDADGNVTTGLVTPTDAAGMVLLKGDIHAATKESDGTFDLDICGGYDVTPGGTCSQLNNYLPLESVDQIATLPKEDMTPNGDFAGTWEYTRKL